MSQQTFCPVDYHFTWSGEWYTWDRTQAIKAARKARDEAAKRAKQEGRQVQKFALPEQLITRGGIGSGHPHVDFCVTVFGLNVH